MSTVLVQGRDSNNLDASLGNRGKVTEISSTGTNLDVATHSVDSTSGLPVADKSVGGAKLVAVGPVTQSHNRNIAAANATYARATNSASWVAGTHISLITIVPVIVSGATPVPGDILGYAIISGPNEAFCAAAFADTGGISVDVQYKPIVMGTPCEIATLLGSDFSGEITQVDILPITTGRFIVEAN